MSACNLMQFDVHVHIPICLSVVCMNVVTVSDCMPWYVLLQ